MKIITLPSNENFSLRNEGEVSRAFVSLDVTDFNEACLEIARLPYKRNADKTDLLCVLKDNGGTCSTKHAILRKVALENQRPDIKLVVGLFKMDNEYTTKIEHTLKKYNLSYIPEAHTYLKLNGQYFDFTSVSSDYSQVRDKLIFEQEIEYDQITSEKVRIHQEYLKQWIETRSEFTLDEIWQIREQCITDLQS